MKRFKIKIKKITCVLSVLACLVCALAVGGKENVFAASSYWTSSTVSEFEPFVGYWFSNDGSDYKLELDALSGIQSDGDKIKFFLVRADTNVYLCAISIGAQSYVSYDLTFLQTSFGGNPLTQHLRSSDSLNNASRKVSTVGYYVEFRASRCTFGWSDDACVGLPLYGDVFSNINSAISYFQGLSADELMSASDTLNMPPTSFDSSSAEYNADLGYLQNVNFSKLSVSNGSSEDMDNVYFKFTWSNATSTGIDIRSDGYDVEYYYKVRGRYRYLWSDNYSTTDTIVSDSNLVSAVSDSKLQFLEDTGIQTSETTNGFAFNQNGGIFSDTYVKVTSQCPALVSTFDTEVVAYLRPVYFDGSNSYYGGWTKVSIDTETGAATYDYGTTPGGTIDTSDKYGDSDNLTIESSGTPTQNTGHGTDLESAGSSVSDKYVSDSSVSGDVWDNAQSLLEGIGNMPILIANVFSFLPDWCLAFIAVSFALLVVLIVYKLVRG